MNIQTANNVLVTNRRSEPRYRTPRPIPQREPAAASGVPTAPVDIAAIRKRQKIASLSDFRVDHIDTPQERKVLQSALETVRRWNAARKTNPTLSLILQSVPIRNDTLRTGYGCGKTTLARSLMYGTSAYLHTGTRPEDARLYTDARFYNAPDILSNLSKSSPVGLYIPRNCPLVVIDDFGAERIGRLEYVSREDQQTEIRSRTFRIVNWCYSNGIGIVITTNESKTELMNLIGGAAWSRLNEMVTAEYFVSMTGVRDYRLYAGGHVN